MTSSSHVALAYFEFLAFHYPSSLPLLAQSFVNLFLNYDHKVSLEPDPEPPPINCSQDTSIPPSRPT